MEDRRAEMVDELIDVLDSEGAVAWWAQAVIEAAARQNVGDRKGWAIDVEFAFVAFLGHAEDNLAPLNVEERQRILNAMQNTLVTEAYFADCPVKMQPRSTTDGA